MLLIVQSHFAVHGYMTFVDGALISIHNDINRILITAITTGNIGNGLFMLITGYFLSQSTEFSLRRFLKVAIQVFTYSILCFVIYTFAFNETQFSIDDLLRAFSPLLHGTYWYFTSYVLIYLFHPFLNTLITHLDQKKFGILIFLMVIIWGCIPSLLGLPVQSSSFLFFCMFYFIGAYIRQYYGIGKGFVSFNRYVCLDKIQTRKFLIYASLIWISVSVLTAWLTPFYRFVYMGSPLIVLLSVLLFLFFLNTNIKSSRLVNVIGSTVGGVYLLSDNPYVRSILYKKIFHIDTLTEENSMYIYTMGFVLATFLLGIIIELFRKRLYDKVERVFLTLFVEK